MREDLAALDAQKAMAQEVAQIERQKREIAVEAEEHILRLMGTKRKRIEIEFSS